MVDDPSKAQQNLQIFPETHRTNVEVIPSVGHVLKGVKYFFILEIIRLESQSNYTTFFLHQGREDLISRTPNEYDEWLSDQGFVRVHQSHLIHLEQIPLYPKADKGYVMLTYGSNVPLSQKRLKLGQI